MGKSFNNSEGGGLSWSRGEDKKDVRLRSLADLGEHLPVPPNKKMIGYRAFVGAEPESIDLPDYSGSKNNEVKGDQLKIEVSTENFDSSEYDNYLKQAETFFKYYQKSLEKGRNYLNESDQKLYRAKLTEIESLKQTVPDTATKVNELKALIDKILSTFSDLEKKIENYKKREVSANPPSESGESITVPVADNQNKNNDEVAKIKAEPELVDGDKNTKDIPEAVHNETKMKNEIFTNPNTTLLDAVEINANQGVVTPPEKDTIERADLSITTSGQGSYNKDFDTAILKGSLSDEPQYKAEIKPDYLKEIKNDSPTEAPVENNVINLAEKIAAKKAELAELEAKLPAKPGNDLGVDPALFEKYLNEELEKESKNETVELIDPESKIPIKTAPAENIVSGQKNFIDKELTGGTKKISAIESKPLSSISAAKLRELNPGISDEQIKVELGRRQESFKELLKYRKELKESFLPYYNSKNEYKNIYTNQIKGGYEVYKKTNWIGKMFGFNPKNLNSLAISEKHKFADSRIAYKDKLESLFKERMGQLNPLDKAFVSEDKLRAAMTDRFLIRPAKETLRLQNELFPQSDRKNIISKYKEVLRNHPKAALSVGALMVGGTVASGGFLAALFPVLTSISFASVANTLSTKFGVNKSERALDSTLKNAKLGANADSLVAAEMEILSASQEVELAKDRRDIHTTLGGMVGGAISAPFTSDYLSNGSESVLGKFYDAIGLTSQTPDGSDVILDSPTNDSNPSRLIEQFQPRGQEVSMESFADSGDYSDYEANEEGEEIFPPGYTGPETMMLYEVQLDDNFWNIMEGQTAAPPLPTLEWVKINQPEHYPELIKLVENVANQDSGLREMLGFGQTMDNLEVGSKVDLSLLDYLAKSIAESKGWMSNVEVDTPEIPEPVRNAISSSVKTYSV